MSFSLKQLIKLSEESTKKSKQYFDTHVFITSKAKVYLLNNGKFQLYKKEDFEFVYVNRFPEKLNKYFYTTPNIYRVIRDKSLPQIGEEFINLTPKKGDSDFDAFDVIDHVIPSKPKVEEEELVCVYEKLKF